MNFVSCVKWVRKGVANRVPEHVNLSEKEIQEILEDTGVDENSLAENQTAMDDEYDLKNYDNEDSSLRASIKGMIEFDTGKKKKKKKRDNKGSKMKNPIREDTSDSEREDEMVKDSDNLLLVGHVDGDMSTVDVYVYNEEDGDMYVHHDFMLNSPPLCVEWLNIETTEGPSNLCAIGTTNPVIELWDLDVMNCVEPVFKLGRSKERNSKSNFGHTNAVLSLSWNKQLPHILASGSVDTRALLWDLDKGSVATELTNFEDKVQALLWSHQNASSLLSGCADGIVRLFDCRVYNEFQEFDCDSPVESVAWHAASEFSCFVGTENGSIIVLDWRNQTQPVLQFVAHQKEVTGLEIVSTNPKLLISVSCDEFVKIWSIKGTKPQLLHQKNFNLEAIHCIDMNPDYPFTACIGGSSQTSNKNVTKIIDIESLLSKSIDTKNLGSPSIEDISISAHSVPLLEQDKKERISKKEESRKFKKKFKKRRTISRK